MNEKESFSFPPPSLPTTPTTLAETPPATAPVSTPQNRFRSFTMAPHPWVTNTRPWPETVDGRALLDELTATLNRFVVLPDFAAETLALWVAHSYAFEYRDVTAYLGIESPEKRCGKTTLLSVLNELVSRPIAAANISSPAFFRVIEEARPTLLIDEADTFLEGNDSLRGILNSGYTRSTAFVMRVTFQENKEPAAAPKPLPAGENPRETPAAGTDSLTMRPALEPMTAPGSGLARYSCWCPKVLATIGGLPETLADRCIVIRMQRKSGAEPRDRVRDMDREAAARLRRQCLRWTADHAEAIARAKPAVPAELNDRAADIWEPLFALADLAGGDWPARSRRAAQTLAASGEPHRPITALLADILLHFINADEPVVFSRHLVMHLNLEAVKNPTRPWLSLRKKKEIDELWLARQLAPYEIRSRTVRLGGMTAKGYVKKDFNEVFRRYVPKSAVDEVCQEPGNEPETNERPTAPVTAESTPQSANEDISSSALGTQPL